MVIPVDSTTKKLVISLLGENEEVQNLHPAVNTVYGVRRIYTERWIKLFDEKRVYWLSCNKYADRVTSIVKIYIKQITGITGLLI